MELPKRGVKLSRLKEWRLYRAYTQADLAQAANVAAVGISRYELDTAHARPSTARKIAMALGVAVEDLMDAPEKSQPHPLADGPLIQQIRALSPKDRRRLALGSAPGWVAGEEDQTLSAMSEAKQVAAEHGVTRDQLHKVLVESSPLLARELLVGMESHDEAAEEAEEAVHAYWRVLYDAVKHERLSPEEMIEHIDRFEGAA